jgi:hypothetical protein
MHAIVHAADIQDRDRGVLVMALLFGLYPFLLKLYADGGYQGAKFQSALRTILSQVNVLTRAVIGLEHWSAGADPAKNACRFGAESDGAPVRSVHF